MAAAPTGTPPTTTIATITAAAMHARATTAERRGATARARTARPAALGASPRHRRSAPPDPWPAPARPFCATRGGDARLHRGERRQLDVHRRVDHGPGRATPANGPLAGEHEEQHRAQGEHVGRRSTGMSADLLRRHVARRPDATPSAVKPPPAVAARVAWSGNAVRRAMPKSSTFTRPAPVTITLPGLMSRWTMPMAAPWRRRRRWPRQCERLRDGRPRPESRGRAAGRPRAPSR